LALYTFRSLSEQWATHDVDATGNGPTIATPLGALRTTLVVQNERARASR
jgi:hypothetical protein